MTGLFGDIRYEIKDVRDPLERHYTPLGLADACVERLRIVRRCCPPTMLVEPGVGGGAFVRSVRRLYQHAEVVGVDIDPQAEGLRICDRAVVGDWLDDGGRQIELLTDRHAANGGVVWVVGNPAFSTAPQWIRRALEMEVELVASILPIGILEHAGDWLRLLVDHPPDVWYPILGRPWPRNTRGTGLFCWEREPGAGRMGEPIGGWRR